MSGIQHGNRLDQLRALLHRTQQQIRVNTRHGHPTREHRHLETRILAAIDDEEQKARARPEVAQAVQQAHVDQLELLADLGVTARDVKDWALAQGLITEIRRGRVATELVHAYANHHQQHPTSTTNQAGATS